jgi:6-pyruvoyltetrahydropterin/6-carboxytetrahydropterin synthase
MVYGIYQILSCFKFISCVADPHVLYYVLTMFTAKVMEGFSAAHRLRGYQGDCERLHGHNYRVEVAVESPQLDDAGIIMDFRDLKQILKKVLAGLDHQYLNELEPFTTINPSAENIASYIFHAVSGSIKMPVLLKEVTVWENDSCCVTYSR